MWITAADSGKSAGKRNFPRKIMTKKDLPFKADSHINNLTKLKKSDTIAANVRF